jgi:putative flippase GtrA
MSPWTKEVLGYAAASGCALILDLATLWVLVNFLSFGYLTAATISFLAGAVLAYALSIKMIFTHHRLQNQAAEFGWFVIIGSAGLAINTAVIFVMVSYVGIHYLFAKGIAASFSFSCNYIARRQMLFTERSTIRGADA